MASTFTTNFGFEEIATGEQSGTWGTTTNFNLDILDRIASYKAVGLSGTTHTLTVREASPGQGTENLQDGMYRVIKFTGALGANNTVTVAPNTAAIYFIFENATTDSGSSGPYSVIISQGSGANVTIENGKSAIVYCDGAGSGAAVTNALNNLQVAALTVDGDATIGDDLTLISDASVLGFGVNTDVTLTHVHDTGLLLNSSMQLQFNDASQNINAPSATVLDINATDEIELNATLADVNANLDVSGTYQGGGTMTTGGNIVIPDAGNIGSASDTDAIAISSAGVVALSAATEASATGTAALTTAGGLGVAKDVWIGDDLVLDSDAAVVSFGDNQEVTLTHVHDTGLLLNSSMQLQFNDASQNINAPSATVLDINATDEIELNATLADVNANLDVSGTYQGGGTMTTGGDIVIPNAGNIGSASDTDAIAISSAGVVTMNQIPVFSAGINVSGGTIAGTLSTAAQANITSLGTLTALTVDDVAIDGKVITMTGSSSDTAVFTAGTNGTLSIVTTDAAATAANIQITADGTVDIDSAGVLTLDSGAAINIEPASGSAILLDGTISVDAGVVTGATSITSTDFVGNVTGNTSGTAATVTTAAQPNITSLGTLTTLTVDNIIINGTNIGHTSDTDAIAIASSGVVTFSQVPVFPDDTVETADIQDNAVTLAKMASGTDGNIISYDASGNPVAIATGSDGQVLTSAGAGAPPAFEDASSGNASCSVTVFTESGTWSKPSNLLYAIIEVQGGGGGGGGTVNPDNDAAGCGTGGGGGGYARKLLLTAALGSTETVTVGAVASGGNGSAGTATAGNASTFAVAGGTDIVGNGGQGGSQNTSTGGTGVNVEAGRDGGSASGGDINITGSPSGPGFSMGNDSWGDTGAQALAIASPGGSGYFGGGGGGGNAATESGVLNGEDGTNGGGGGGAVSGDGGGAATGGDGGAGLVVVTQYLSA